MATWRSFWLVAVIFAVALVALAYLHREGIKARLRALIFGQQTPARAHLEIGQALPPLDLLNLAGGRDIIAAEPGHVLVLNVFATWCPDCVSEAPVLAQLRGVYSPSRVEIIGIDQAEYPPAILQFARDYNWNFPIFIDDSHETEQLLGVHFIPATFVVDDRGRVWANVAGPVSLPEMEHLVQTGLTHLTHKG